MNSLNSRLQITSMMIEAWVDGTNADGTPYKRFGLHIRRADDAPGLRRVWFILSDAELEALVRGKQIEFGDGFHRLSVWGDCSTFYDLEWPREDAGSMAVPYLRLDIPRPLWRYFARVARFIWREQQRAIASGADPYRRPHRVEFDVDLALVERFTRRYGVGRGEVDCRFSDKLREEMSKRPALVERVEYVKRIARNSTRSIYHRARLDVSDDGSGFYWRALTPRGRCIMNGGIVNHARDKSGDDWSIHT